MKTELELLHQLDHPHITHIKRLLSDDDFYYIVMEYLSGGDLLGRIQQTEPFTEQKAVYILKQILLAINYLHC